MRAIGQSRATAATSGLAAWLLMRLRRGTKAAPRLSLIERIPLGPRQSLALVEAEGQRLLVATCGDGGPAFYPLDPMRPQQSHSLRRVSW